MPASDTSRGIIADFRAFVMKFACSSGKTQKIRANILYLLQDDFSTLFKVYETYILHTVAYSIAARIIS